jgi:hypothetical protein
MPSRGNGDKGSAERRDAITRGHEPLAVSDPVRKISRENLQKTGGRLGNSFDKADHRFVDSNHIGQKKRNQGINHLGTEIHEKADQPGNGDVFAESEEFVFLIHFLPLPFLHAH